VNMNHKTILAVGGMIALFVLGVAFLVWPAYRQAHRINSQTQELIRKSDRLEDDTSVVKELAERLQQLRRRIEEDLKTVPNEPRVAEMMRRLSLPVDGVTVRDQTFAAGEPKPASQQADIPFKAIPLTVELDASFDAVFSLLRATEQSPQLVRTRSLHIERKSEKDDNTISKNWLRATISLEAVYGSVDAAGSAQRQDDVSLAGIDARSTP